MAESGSTTYSTPDTPMKILTSYLQQIEKLASEENVSEELKHLIGKATNMAAGLDDYLEEVTSSEGDVLRELAARSDVTPWDKLYEEGKTMFKLPKECLTGHVEGQFLKTLVAVTGSLTVLEIGMFTGYATLAMAEALPSGGRVITLELEPFLREFVAPSHDKSPHGSKIDVRIGPASDSLKVLASEKRKFDLVFIDADKTGYLHYYKTIMHLDLLSDRGVICVDNTLYKGEVYLSERGPNGQALREFNQYVKEDPRVEQVSIQASSALVAFISTRSDFITSQCRIIRNLSGKMFCIELSIGYIRL